MFVPGLVLFFPSCDCSVMVRTCISREMVDLISTRDSYCLIFRARGFDCAMAFTANVSPFLADFEFLDQFVNNLIINT